MSNSKISALASATTPLAGTEVLPIVQSGATVKATVANITGAGLYPGYFTTLTSTGNTILGDATTDTVQANGYVGIGGAASADTGLYVRNTALTSSGQLGAYIFPTVTSAATGNAEGLRARVGTAATAFTVTAAYALRVLDSSKGAGSTITSQYGLAIADQTNGTNNYGVASAVSSGSNKWNIYANGTAANYFAGGINIGATTDPGAGNLSLTGNVVQGTAGKGINFTANTPASGMTSQLLNWYEEGTWTPNQGAGLTLVGAFGSSGTYTRIGRQVTVRGQVTGATSVAVTAAGVISSNLPYAASVTHAGSMFNGAVNASGVIQITSSSVVAATTIAATPSITFTATYTV